jgi:tripartite-type tricarboxylate transporter receptor subunit TctC
MQRKRAIFAALVSAMCLVGLPSADAQPDFYSGKTVRFTIGSDPGSAGDQYIRLIAQFVGRHIPGNPVVIVQNMPGAGGLVHANWMYNIADKDGTIVGLTRESAPFEPLFLGKDSQAKFDPLKFNWIGSPNSFPNVAVAWHTAPVKKAEDLLEKELIVGGIGQIGSTNDAYFLRNVLGFKFRVVTGYPGPAAVDNAMEKGELQGRASAGWTGLKTRGAAWLKEGKVVILYQMGLAKHPEIPQHVPLLIDFAKSEEDRALIRLKYASNEIGFPFFLPPGTAKDRVESMRKAFVATFADPDFKAAAQKQKLDVFPVSGERIHELIEQVYSAPPALLTRLSEASKPPKE